MSSTPPEANTFSVRIVSLDYYMSCPIEDLDFSYSSFQGRNVEEVPVIRIYGSTPAGQKTCLHIHRALPYLYILCPDNVLKDPKEGDRFIHMLSNALEKALKHKSSSTTKRQHVHECHLVRARKFYGYHSSDDLFVKIYLYYSHEVARTASLLLEGAILNTTFQPYESHIPYLLQFLVDYNLYGMGHIHVSKFKFRPPLPDGYASSVAFSGKQDMQAHGNSPIWVSSAVPDHLIWPDSTSGYSLEYKINHLFSRQSTCSLEVDACVDDILNQKYRMYTSLSQTISEVKMVQSLVPIWEEEYDRSGTPVAVKSTDLSKPTPEDVLARFVHGLDYEKALGDLCAIEKSFPCGISTIEWGGKLESLVESSNSSIKESALLGHQSSFVPSGGSLKCTREEDNYAVFPYRSLFQESTDGFPSETARQSDGLKSTADKTLSKVDVDAEEEIPEAEALGLLSWLATSQAAEDFNTDDVLINEALLSPLLSSKSYKEVLEMAHLDYENASQKECQDILDSLERFPEFEGLKEQASRSTCQDFVSSLSSGSVIPQTDGSFDDEFRTPHKDDSYEANLNVGRGQDSVYQVGKLSNPRSGYKHKRSKLLWGQLPFSFKQNAEKSEPSLGISFQSEMNDDDSSSSSSGTKTSVRDLMRRKRRRQTEQSDTTGPMHYKSDREDNNAVSHESPKIESSRAFNGVVQENVTCPTACMQDACTKEDESLCSDYYYPTNQKPLVGRQMQSNMQVDGNLHFHKISTEGCIGTTTDLPEPFQSGTPRASLLNLISGDSENVIPEASLCFMRTCNSNFSVETDKCSSFLADNQNINEDPEYNKCIDHCIDELLEEKLDICTEDFATTHVKQTLMHDTREYKGSQENEIIREMSFQNYMELDSPLHKNVLSKNVFSGGWMGSLDIDSSCSDMLKRGNTDDYVEMTFSMMPPSRDEGDKFSQDSPGTTVLVEKMADMNVDRQHVDNLLPNSPWKFEDRKSYEPLNDDNLAFHYKHALGVPTHFQNDGSVLYLLTHALLPPALGTVNQWLLEVEDSSPNVSGGDPCNAFSPESNPVVTHVNSVLLDRHVSGTHRKENAVDAHELS